MLKSEYSLIEGYMLSHMQDSAHDMHHIYRVLHTALDIAGHMGEVFVDMDVLLAACLLHDIGREKQFADSNVCHAQAGGDMAYEFLIAHGWEQQKARHVKACISSHRYRYGNNPESIEAQILFDADKLDVSGAIGIARTLIYGGQVGEPLYIMDDKDRIVLDGGEAEKSSFFQEYHYKLKKLYDSFFTERAKELAAGRQKVAICFYDGLLKEITESYDVGTARLVELLD